MSGLWNHLSRSGASEDTMLVSGTTSLSRGDVIDRVDRLAKTLHRLGLRRVALFADNGADWIIADLACQYARVCVTPLPLFFSEQQLGHALASSAAEAVIADGNISRLNFGGSPGRAEATHATGDLALYLHQPERPSLLPPGTQKITFTSGTTGQPKGVCLSSPQQLAVAEAIAAVIGSKGGRHLCMLPLSTLLENLAGVYAPLLADGTVIAPPLAELGLSGSSGLNLTAMLGSIVHHRPQSLILVPEMLNAVTAAAEQGWRPPAALEFVAVGGGKVAPELLSRARAAGVPAFEGYGLSECASVVSLNAPGADRPGSVGLPLPHVSVRIDAGEIVVVGNAFLGYADQPESWHLDAVRTGDIGRIDSEGFVYIEGRARNQIITSFGRNLSPEWVESELLCGPLLSQAVIFGDALPYCVALLCPRDPTATDQQIAAWVGKINQRLPDYARVLDWRRLARPVNSQDGTATENGRPRRDVMQQKFRAEIDAMYSIRQEAISR